jgi:hypothetical protein
MCTQCKRPRAFSFKGRVRLDFLGFSFSLFFLFAVLNVFPKMFPIAPHLSHMFCPKLPFFHLLVQHVHFAQVWTGYSTNLLIQKQFCNLTNFSMRKANI